MLRLLSLVLVALVLSQATGLRVLSESDGCADSCPGEEPAGHCPPDCVWCACCPGALPLVVERMASPSGPEWRGTTLEEPVPVISTPYPHEIYHVPRSLA
jgi:hypothetical protein